MRKERAVTNRPTKPKDEDPIIKRLDALLRVNIEALTSTKVISEAAVARALDSVGLTPTEIARILGKKSRTAVSKYLYVKK
jgi:DNA-binding transcriptional ArsR family regulator